MVNGGLRSNQFSVNISFPSIVANGALAGQKLQFMAKSATLPESSLADVTVMFRGRPVHFAGEREFQPWNIDVYCDNDFVVRNAFEAWVDTIQDGESTGGTMQPSIYQVDMQVYSLDRNDNILKEYTFRDAFPLTIGQIALDWDDNNRIATFPVTFQYNYWFSADSQGTIVS
jgi:hypothetical protein